MAKEFVIAPSNGRIVLFTPAKDDRHVKFLGQPLAAQVVHVHNERCVNLAVFDADGTARGRHSVPLLQGDDVKPEAGFYAEWMPYQKGQAAKTEQLEKQAASAGLNDKIRAIETQAATAAAAEPTKPEDPAPAGAAG